MDETLLAHFYPQVTIVIIFNIITTTTFLLILIIITMIILKRAEKENVIRLIPLLSTGRSILTKGDQLSSTRLCNCIVFLLFSFSGFAVTILKADSGRFWTFQFPLCPRPLCPSPCSKRAQLVMAWPQKKQGCTVIDLFGAKPSLL